MSLRLTVWLTDCVLFADNSLSVHAFLCLFLANLCGCRLYLTNCPMSSTMSSKSGRNSISGEQDKTRQVDKRKSDDDDWRDSSADLILYIINSPRVSARGLNYSNCSTECFFCSQQTQEWLDEKGMEYEHQEGPEKAPECARQCPVKHGQQRWTASSARTHWLATFHLITFDRATNSKLHSLFHPYSPRYLHNGHNFQHFCNLCHSYCLGRGREQFQLAANDVDSCQGRVVDCRVKRKRRLRWWWWWWWGLGTVVCGGANNGVTAISVIGAGRVDSGTATTSTTTSTGLWSALMRTDNSFSDSKGPLNKVPKEVLHGIREKLTGLQRLKENVEDGDHWADWNYNH